MSLKFSGLMYSKITAIRRTCFPKHVDECRWSLSEADAGSERQKANIDKVRHIATPCHLLQPALFLTRSETDTERGLTNPDEPSM